MRRGACAAAAFGFWGRRRRVGTVAADPRTVPLSPLHVRLFPGHEKRRACRTDTRRTDITSRGYAGTRPRRRVDPTGRRRAEMSAAVDVVISAGRSRTLVQVLEDDDTTDDSLKPKPNTSSRV
jgi:hypothetical protein